MGDYITLQQQFEAFLKAQGSRHIKRTKLQPNNSSKHWPFNLRNCPETCHIWRWNSRTTEGRTATLVNPSSSAHMNQGEEIHSSVPRYAKLDFPKYDGLFDPLGLLNRCQHFSTIRELQMKIRLGWLLSIFWFLKLERDRQNLHWEEFKAQM